MIEELTPAILGSVVVLVIALSALLTVLVSALILWRYRRAVLRAMARSARGAGGPDRDTAPAQAGPAASVGSQGETSTLPSAQPFRLVPGAHPGCPRALREPWYALSRTLAPGLAYVAVMTLAASEAFAWRMTPLRYLMTAWVYAWPMVMVAALSAPLARRSTTVGVVAYFAPIVGASFLVAAMPFEASSEFGGDVAAYRTTVTPPWLFLVWVVANGPPTVLLVLFFNRWLRAVGAPVLGFVTTVVAGCVACWLALGTRAGSGFFSGTAIATGIPVHLLLAIAAVSTVALFAAIGWRLLQWIRSGYLRKTLNDRSLALDATWLVFGSCHAIWLALAGVGWAASAFLAFAAYKLAVFAVQSLVQGNAAANRGLVFLRVFSLGRRSDLLFDAVARYWRFLGTIALITGPDVAHSTVQPHQLLDFVAGRLASHFVADRTSLQQRMRQRDVVADRDGTFRVENFFCHADTWQAVLAQLVGEGSVVLMDMRGLSAQNTGCVFELRYLVDRVPLGRCLLIVDGTTDRAFLRATLSEAWQRLDPLSPNRSLRSEDAKMHEFRPGTRALRGLVRGLCEAGRPGAGVRLRRCVPSRARDARVRRDR